MPRKKRRRRNTQNEKAVATGLAVLYVVLIFPIWSWLGPYAALIGLNNAGMRLITAVILLVIFHLVWRLLTR
jgi:hypothetical protein